MKRSLRRTGAAGVAVLALGMGLAACGSDDDSSASDTTSSTDSSSAATTESSSAATDDSSSADAGTTEAGADTFGPGCSAIPTSGKGSFNGMVTDPVATAASNNPLLKTLVTAVGVAGLGDTLNNAPALTVFAPTDDAFAKIPAATLKKVLADKATLTAILTHHVIGQQLDPTQVVGQHDTLNNDTVTVDGDTNGMTVEGAMDGNANVICGNIPTANATVYVIDQVLMPTSK